MEFNWIITNDENCGFYTSILTSKIWILLHRHIKLTKHIIVMQCIIKQIYFTNLYYSYKQFVK